MKMQLIGSITDPTVIEIVGLLSLGYLFVYRLAKFGLNWLLNNCSLVSKRILKPGPGDYAVVTGASDGIGLEYARQLAEKGYNLMLLSRTEEKLKRVARDIQQQYPQCKKVETLAVDFSSTDIYDRIKQKLERLDGPIHVLVNNVGTANSYPEYFANYSTGYHLRLINVNIVSVTAMSEIVLKIWTTQKGPSVAKRPKGVLINISSTVASVEMPLFSTYSASKVYMSYLSKILSIEYARDNILVQNVTPGQVDTRLSATMRDKSQVVQPKDFVKYALQAVGAEQSTNGHPKHKFINSVFVILKSLLWQSVFDKFIFYLTKKLRADYDKIKV